MRPSQPPDSGGERTAAEVAAAARAAEVVLTELKADVEADITLYSAYHLAMLEVAKGGLDRARASADSVQKAAAAIATVYVGILGVSFSVAERPLPSRGAIAPIFLGLSITLAAVYLAYLTRGDSVPEHPSPTSTREGAKVRARNFITWVGAGAAKRGRWLRAAVVSLGLGVSFLAAPFITLESNSAAPQASGTELRNWPVAPTDGDIELRTILYEAQVDETAALRLDESSPATDDGNDIVWWLAALGGLVAVALVPRYVGRDLHRSTTSEDSALPGTVEHGE